MPIPDFVPKIRVLVVDDHPMMNESMCLALEAEEDMQVVGVAQNGRAAIEQALALKPDVIVMDLFLPDMDGIRATAEIAQANPTARVLVITSSAENEHVQRAIEAGAMAYIVKDSSREQFILGVRTLASGRVFLPAEIGEKLVRGLQENKRQSLPRPGRSGQSLPRVSARCWPCWAKAWATGKSRDAWY